MAAGDLHNNIKVSRVISPQSPGATGAITGQIIDRQNYPELTFVIGSGAQTTTGITVTPVVLHGAVTGTLVSAPDADLFELEADVAATFAGATGANKVDRLGYKGNNRYVRLDLIVAVASTGLYDAHAVQSRGRKKPVA